MTTHKATRIWAGKYMYRGWTIEEVGRFDMGQQQWNMTHPDDTCAHDSETTLRRAKQMIDWYESVELAEEMSVKEGEDK